VEYIFTMLFIGLGRNLSR